MMRARALFIVAVLSCAAADAAGLRHDLFQRPPLEALKPAVAAPVKADTAPPAVEWKPELRAIIAGGGNGIVNVEGRIVQMGQEIDGYRLVELQERQATFVKDKVRYTLFLKPLRAAEAPAPAAPPGAPATEPRPLGTLKASDVLAKPSASEPPAPEQRAK